MKVTIFAAALAFQFTGGALGAQEYVVAVAEENFRARPNGAKLGTLVKGAPLDASRAQGSWVEASLRGWIWQPSVREGGVPSTVVVSRAPGENVRAAPSAGGRLIGTVLRGTALTRLGKRGDWIEIRYDGWIWQPSLATGTGAAGRASDDEQAPADPPAGSAASRAPRADRTLSVPRENLRSAPNGTRRGVLNRGADLATLETRGRWLRVAVHGYFWAASAGGSGGARTVTPATENLRIAPGSEIAGVLDRGTPLAVVGRAGSWLEVRLEGWIWAPSTLALAKEDPARARGPAREADTQALSRAGAVARPAAATAAEPAADAPAGTAATARIDPPAGPPRVLARSVPLKDSPGGALVGQALTGSAVVPVRSAGDWVKIRLEGWVPRDAFATSAAPEGPATVAMVVAAPDAYRGARVTWTLELIAVEQADQGRGDFSPGEHYLLTRSAVGEREYVYVTLSAALAARLNALPAFTPLTVRGLLRTGRSALVGNPIVELEELLEPAAP